MGFENLSYGGCVLKCLTILHTGQLRKEVYYIAGEERKKKILRDALTIRMLLSLIKKYKKYKNLARGLVLHNLRGPFAINN